MLAALCFNKHIKGGAADISEWAAWSHRITGYLVHIKLYNSGWVKTPTTLEGAAEK